ncbi:MAG: hypothetical protein AAF555_04635 [Verrucomicrobiota bacterium]
METPDDLSALEVEVIDLFVGGVRALGLPKSIGEIYGLLYVSPEPLHLDRLIQRLRISRGSASQGVRFLRNLGAIQTNYIPGDRRDHYVAVAELKKLVSGFLESEIQPHLLSGKERLHHLGRTLTKNKGDRETAAFLKGRVDQLRKWHRWANQVVPMVKGFLG